MKLDVYLNFAGNCEQAFRFYEQQNYKSALEAYERVLKHPKSQLYDLALVLAQPAQGDGHQVGYLNQGNNWIICESAGAKVVR